MPLRKYFKSVRTAARILYKKLWKIPAALSLELFHPQHFGGIKRFFVRRYVGSIGEGSIISPGFFSFDGDNTMIGDRCSMGYAFKIFDFSPVLIGDDLLASHNVTLIAGTHTDNIERTYVPGPITIGKKVWVGANVLIVGPCNIGDNSIVGANSFVKGDFPAGCLIAGSPAKVIKQLA